MRVAPINYLNAHIYQKQKAANNNNLNTVPNFGGTIKKGKQAGSRALVQNQADFIKKGGTVHYDMAVINGQPYEGQLARTYKDEKVGHYYSDGESFLIEFENKNPFLHQEEGAILGNKFVMPMPSTSGGKKIVWTGENNRYIYIEDFDTNGKLSTTRLAEFETPGKDGKNDEKVSQVATFESDGTTASRVETKLTSPIYRDKLGYSSKITNFKNGKIDNEFVHGAKSKNKSSELSTTKFGENEKPIRTEEAKVQYFADKNAKVPTAVSDETITEYDNNGAAEKIIDTKYKAGDETQGLNPIRQLVYKQRPQTRREIDPKAGVVTYIDIKTNEPYAIERYSTGSSIPSEIEDIETGRTALIEAHFNNVLSVDIINSNNTLMQKYTFKPQNGVWIKS